MYGKCSSLNRKADFWRHFHFQTKLDILESGFCIFYVQLAFHFEALEHIAKWMHSPKRSSFTQWIDSIWEAGISTKGRELPLSQRAPCASASCSQCWNQMHRAEGCYQAWDQGWHPPCGSGCGHCSEKATQPALAGSLCCLGENERPLFFFFVSSSLTCYVLKISKARLGGTPKAFDQLPRQSKEQVIGKNMQTSFCSNSAKC